MHGLRNASAFEAFEQMEGRINQMEAEAEAGAELAEEYSGDVLAHRFQQLEVTAGADEDLESLKRKMGILPPEPPPEQQAAVRVEQQVAADAPLDQAEREELERALLELEAQEQQELRIKR